MSKKNKKRKNRKERKNRKLSGFFSKATGKSADPNEIDNGDVENNSSDDEESCSLKDSLSLENDDKKENIEEVVEEAKHQDDPKGGPRTAILEIRREPVPEASKDLPITEILPREPHVLQEAQTEAEDKNNEQLNSQEESIDVFSEPKNCPYCKQRLPLIRLIIVDRNGRAHIKNTVFSPCDCPGYFLRGSRTN